MKTLYSCTFSEGAIGRFLADYYDVAVAPLAGGEYRIQQCLGCDCYFQAEVGEDRLLAEIYGEWIKADPHADPLYLRDMASPARSRDGHELMVASEVLGIPLREMKTFDYGMGFAGWARVANALGCRSFGSDLAPNRVAFAREHRIEIVDDQDTPEGFFHFICTEQVLEHVIDPLALARRLARSLASGGILKVSVPSAPGVPQVLEKLRAGASEVTRDEIMPIQPLEHVNCFTRRSIVELGQRVGLVPVRPSPLQAYAFVRYPGAIGFQDFAWTLKELVRPWYQYLNSSNLYMWLRKQG